MLFHCQYANTVHVQNIFCASEKVLKMYVKYALLISPSLGLKSRVWSHFGRPRVLSILVPYLVSGQ